MTCTMSSVSICSSSGGALSLHSVKRATVPLVSMLVWLMCESLNFMGALLGLVVVGIASVTGVGRPPIQTARYGAAFFFRRISGTRRLRAAAVWARFVACVCAHTHVVARQHALAADSMALGPQQETLNAD
jgi:hypothetical protein